MFKQKKKTTTLFTRCWFAAFGLYFRCFRHLFSRIWLCMTVECIDQFIYSVYSHTIVLFTLKGHHTTVSRSLLSKVPSQQIWRCPLVWDSWQLQPNSCSYKVALKTAAVRMHVIAGWRVCTEFFICIIKLNIVLTPYATSIAQGKVCVMRVFSFVGVLGI